MPTVRVYSATSRWDYTIVAGQALNNGEAIMPYFGLLSRIKNNDTEVRRVQYSLTGGAGVRGTGENITKIELYIPATITEYVSMNVIEGAIYVKNRGLINYYYTNDKVGRQQNDINEIRKQTDKLTFKTLTGELKVDVSGQRVDISGCDVRTKGMWLNTETQHMNNPASLGDPNIIKSADGAMSSYINGATNYYNVSTGKLASGNMAPINTVITQYDSTADIYRQSLCVRDSEMYSAMTGAGIVVGGKNATGSFKTLRLDDNGRVDISGQNIKISDGTNVATVNTPANETTKKGLDTNAYLVAYNKSSSTNTYITSTNPPGTTTTRALDTFINNSASASRGDVRTGINVYTISIPKKQYVLSGYTLVANGIFGYNGGSMTHNNGLDFAFYNMTAYAFCSVAKTLNYEYVDNNWALQTNSMSLPANAWTAITTNSTTSMKGINNYWTDQRNSEVLTLSYTNGSAPYAVGAITSNNYFNGIIFIPVGYIGRITQLYFYANAGSIFHIVKFSSTGFMKKVIYTGSNYSNSSIPCTVEGLGEPIYPTEAVYVYREGTATDSYIYGAVVLEPY